MPKNKSWDHWTEAELENLTEWAGKKPLKEIARDLGRTETAVTVRASVMGLSLCYSREWVRITTKDVKTAVEIRKRHRFATTAAREMGVAYVRFMHILKYAKNN